MKNKQEGGSDLIDRGRQQRSPSRIGGGFQRRERKMGVGVSESLESERSIEREKETVGGGTMSMGTTHTPRDRLRGK